MKKSMRFRKLFAIVFAAVMCFCLASCGEITSLNEGMSNGENESFLGCFSEETFPTLDDAASAFVRTEIKGDSLKASYLSFESEGKAAKEEIAALAPEGLGEEDILSAEVGKVRFRTKPANEDSPKEEGWTEGERRVCFVSLSEGYRYCVLAEKTGEILSDSYYKEMLRAERFANCTQDFKSVVTVELKQGTRHAKAELTMLLTVRACETAIRLRMSASVRTVGEGAGLDPFPASSAKTDTAFIIQRGNRVYSCTEEVDKWKATQIKGVETLTEWLSQNEETQPGFLDHSYFVKTDEGFALAPESLRLFAKNYASEYYGDGANVEGEVNYTVENGNISHSNFEISMATTVNNITVGYHVSALCRYVDYGKTSVTLSADLLRFLDTL